MDLVDAMALTPAVPALRRLGRATRNGYSNFGEEQILAHYIEKLLPSKRQHTAVDLGAGDGVRHSNTHALFRQGWAGLVVDADPQQFSRLARTYRAFPEVFSCRCRISPSNVVSLLEAYEIPVNCEVVSLDIDSYDHWVLDALLSQFRPRIIVTEINEKIPPPLKFVVNYDPDFVLQHHFYGQSVCSLEELCARHDYALICLEYNNAFLAPRELRGVRHIDALTAYRVGYLDRADRMRKFPLNSDMELLHSMRPPDAVTFLNKFFARHKGKYRLSIGS